MYIILNGRSELHTHFAVGGQEQALGTETVGALCGSLLCLCSPCLEYQSLNTLFALSLTH